MHTDVGSSSTNLGQERRRVHQCTVKGAHSKGRDRGIGCGYNSR